jgi:hypothetical protein
MQPVKEAAGLTLLVWSDRFNRGGSRCFARGFACGLFLGFTGMSEAAPRSALVSRPDLT